MDKNIENYVVVLKGCIDKDACKQTVKEMENAEWHQHQYHDIQTGKYSSIGEDKELEVSWSNNITTKNYIMQRIHDSFGFYLEHLQFPWFNGWKGYTDVRFNRYNEEKLMALHCDHIHSMFDGERKGIPIMTFLAVLNEDYIGGEFVMWDDTVIDLEEGDALVFPSCFLYPHRVEPVKRGVRYSCVSWAW